MFTEMSAYICSNMSTNVFTKAATVMAPPPGEVRKYVRKHARKQICKHDRTTTPTERL